MTRFPWSPSMPHRNNHLNHIISTPLAPPKANLEINSCHFAYTSNVSDYSLLISIPSLNTTTKITHWLCTYPAVKKCIFSHSGQSRFYHTADHTKIIKLFRPLITVTYILPFIYNPSLSNRQNCFSIPDYTRTNLSYQYPTYIYCILHTINPTRVTLSNIGMAYSDWTRLLFNY